MGQQAMGLDIIGKGKDDNCNIGHSTLWIMFGLYITEILNILCIAINPNSHEYVIIIKVESKSLSKSKYSLSGRTAKSINVQLQTLWLSQSYEIVSHNQFILILLQLVYHFKKYDVTEFSKLKY